ncbi:hypothetical protein BT67DRAFT_434064 [Trichocladium antarcticum]|uniref:BZIP domain-containing protein n=1 Tax=Trichocladium antarcticum TaxID=1450529 RepID=A0AAN6UKV4_9PEZI|nr:hypothetical protein BT67DRAFT_434064 [Trichocladium antarcticum]
MLKRHTLYVEINGSLLFFTNGPAPTVSPNPLAICSDAFSVEFCSKTKARRSPANYPYRPVSLSSAKVSYTGPEAAMYQTMLEWQSHESNNVATTPETPETPLIVVFRDTCQVPCQTAASEPVPSSLDEPPLAPFQSPTHFQSPSGRHDAPHGRSNTTQLFSPQGSSGWTADMNLADGVWSWPRGSSSYFLEQPDEGYRASTMGDLGFDAAVDMSMWAGSFAAPELGMYWGFNQPDAAMQSPSYIDASQSSPSHCGTVHSHSAASGAADYRHGHHRPGEAITWEPTDGSGDNQALLPAQGTVDLSAYPGPCTGGVQPSGSVVEKERRKRGRPRLYLEDGTRAVSARSSKQSIARTSPADKGSLQSPPLLDSAVLDGTAAGDTKYTIFVPSNNGEIPASPTAVRQPRPRVADRDKAAHTRARNKAAATRYRSKTQVNIAKAEDDEREAALHHNEQLAQVDQLRKEVLQLKHELLAQARCGCPLIQAYLSDATRTPGSIARRRDSESGRPNTGTTSSPATTPAAYRGWWEG